jgi:hypothetical protein
MDAMHRYRNQEIPARGQRVDFTVSQYLNDISFQRPYFDEEEELFAEWGLPLTFYTLLPFPKLLPTIISAILLEKKLALISPNLRLLSAIV